MAMLADSDEQVRNVAVNKALMIVGEIQEDLVLKDDLSSDEDEGGDLTSGDSEVKYKYRKRNKLVRKFHFQSSMKKPKSTIS